jgi:hypothetical protein
MLHSLVGGSNSFCSDQLAKCGLCDSMVYTLMGYNAEQTNKVSEANVYLVFLQSLTNYFLCSLLPTTSRRSILTKDLPRLWHTLIRV